MRLSGLLFWLVGNLDGDLVVSEDVGEDPVDDEVDDETQDESADQSDHEPGLAAIKLILAGNGPVEEDQEASGADAREQRGDDHEDPSLVVGNRRDSDRGTSAGHKAERRPGNLVHHLDKPVEGESCQQDEGGDENLPHRLTLSGLLLATLAHGCS